LSRLDLPLRESNVTTSHYDEKLQAINRQCQLQRFHDPFWLNHIFVYLFYLGIS